MSSTTSPRTSLAKLKIYSKPKPFKVMILGQTGVGKTALVVRFITKRFIGEYDPSLEKVYTFHTVIDSEVIHFEILDSAGEPHESECTSLEANIRWAEAFVLVYSVTDKCSFDECSRLKFLINYNKRRRRLSSVRSKESLLEVPVVLVGNKTDVRGDRMVSTDDGQRRSKEIGCVCFHEISVRESVDQVWAVFRDIVCFWQLNCKGARVSRAAPAGVKCTSGIAPAPAPASPHLTSSDDLPTEDEISPTVFYCGSEKRSLSHFAGRSWTEIEHEEGSARGLRSERSNSSSSESAREPRPPEPFRGRAATDGHVVERPARWRPTPPPAPPPQRRMSISMRGNYSSMH